MATLTVVYPKHEGAKFDSAYYTATHMPLAAEVWTPHGYLGGEVLYPVDETQAYAAITLLRFADQAAIDASMGAERTGEVVADMANFTDIAPVLYRAAD